MKNTAPKSKAASLKKPVILLTAAAALFAGGVFSIETAKAAPGFKVMNTTLSPFVTVGYARVVYGNMPSFKKMTENFASPSAVTWREDTTNKTSDNISGSIGIQIGKYFALSTGGTTYTTTRFKGVFSTSVDYYNKFTYTTHFYQIVKLMAGYPLLSNAYYPFVSLSANYEKLIGKYNENRELPSVFSAAGTNSARAVLPGIGLGLLVNLPKTDNHLSMKFEYEFIAGKNASRHANVTSTLKAQVFNRIPSRNQFLIGLRYTI